MLKVGIVGFGFMGRMHFRWWNQLEGAKVTAICDANPNIQEDIKKPVGNIAGASAEVNFDEIALFSDFEEMLQEGDMDAISLTLPTYLHAETTQKALRAGYHVLCEKPMALTVEECDQMVQAAGESGKVLLIGQCLRFWPEYTKARAIVESGQYGKLLAASFRRLGAPPDWGQDDWFKKVQLSGGLALDLHIHDADFIHYLCGMPEAVDGCATTGPQGELLHMSAHYFYPDHHMISAEASWVMSSSFGFEMSFNLMLEHATLVFTSGEDNGLQVFPDDAEPYTPELAEHDGYYWEIDHFSRLARGQAVPEVSTPQQSRDSIRLVLAEVESIEKSKRITLV